MISKCILCSSPAHYRIFQTTWLFWFASSRSSQGVAAFGGATEFFKTCGSSDIAETIICFDAHVNLFQNATARPTVSIEIGFGTDDTGSLPCLGSIGVNSCTARSMTQ